MANTQKGIKGFIPGKKPFTADYGIIPKSAFKKGNVPWNKGLPKEKNPLFGRSRPDMLGHIPWNKGKPHLGKEKNPNWKGGISTEAEKIRSSIESTMWKNNVYFKNNYSCQRCKKRGGHITAHHIQNFSQFPELRFETSNGITFCRKCHEEFHHIYGKKNNTKEQIEEFIGHSLNTATNISPTTIYDFKGASRTNTQESPTTARITPAVVGCRRNTE